MNKKSIFFKLGSWALVFGIVMSLTIDADGKAKNKKATKKAKSDQGREFHFDGLSVDGKYRSAGEAVATVEEEKVLQDLLGVRGDFKDRTRNETQRR